MFIATLVAPDGLKAGDISMAADAVRGRAGPVVDGVACDVRFDEDPTGARTALQDALPTIDIIVQIAADRRRSLIVADMDSTMITVECIDELADYVGLKTEVAEVTERAMRGEIDFAGALRDRVALLAGMPETTVAECLRERVRIMGGAQALIGTVRAHGGYALLVSGGFTHFTGPVASEIGFDRAVANRLVVRDGVLTGVTELPIVDADTKRVALLTEIASQGLSLSKSLAVGDGANDIPMIQAAGLGVAYHAKPKTEAAADARVKFGDLSVILYAMGFSKPSASDECWKIAGV
ncbi:phosphoserine phosphatase SerB [Sphingomonas sp.]|uniref:phosphoserine phosphatase SerB n=1 Tax=Sphingomonas sp. TaxID=28214 RepID=UPI0025D315AC|nr:phosphoserine phosphatase SerB [Sphingomonas sp.]